MCGNGINESICSDLGFRQPITQRRPGGGKYSWSPAARPMSSVEMTPASAP